MPAQARPVAANYTAADGQQLAVWQWPLQHGVPKLHWAHANGYHARTYAPLIERLRTDINVCGWDMRGHGASATAGLPGTLRRWSTYYRDLVSLLDACAQPIWLAGHSVGAIVSLMAAARRPDKVRGLVLVEPVLLSPWHGLQMAGLRLVRQAHRFKLAQLAARRRETFASRAAAMTNYRGKGGFRTWPEEWLAAYVEHGFVDEADGVRLVTPAQWESDSFAAVECNAWRGIARLQCPVTALAGEHGSTFGNLQRRLFARLAPGARIQVVPGTTHFVPMERPDVVQGAIEHMIHGASVG